MDKEIIKTPKVKLKWPFLQSPDDRFNKDKPVYRVDLIFDPKDPGHKTFLNQRYKEYDAIEGSNQPFYYEEKDEETGHKTGMIGIKAKSVFAPKLFDSKSQLVDVELNVGNGTTARAALVVNPYYGIAGKTGMNFYLQAVQIIDLVEYKGASADFYGFEEEEGYEKKDVLDQEVADKADEIREKLENPDTPPEGLPF